MAWSCLGVCASVCSLSLSLSHTHTLSGGPTRKKKRVGDSRESDGCHKLVWSADSQEPGSMEGDRMGPPCSALPCSWDSHRRTETSMNSHVGWLVRKGVESRKSGPKEALKSSTREIPDVLIYSIYMVVSFTAHGISVRRKNSFKVINQPYLIYVLGIG
ncbi:hypothetical protein GGR50DRAFT_665763 [Xylaria sp. CBS 124048]|nr:hypothetical protein GGR50DRAFT_665763 [Xylaria sp. CBS 124048]